MHSVGDPASKGTAGTVVVLSAGASPYLPQILELLSRISGWTPLLLWSGSGRPPNLPGGFRLHSIPPSEFGHGRTRNLAVSLSEGPLISFLSDDATPAGPDIFKAYEGLFEDAKVGAVFGRQIARDDAGLGERLFRQFCYPAHAMLGDAVTVRLRSFPVSNANAAYRVRALEAVGGFPSSTTFGEDRLAAQMIADKGWAVAYLPTAAVYHSHRDSMVARFRRGWEAGTQRVQGMTEPGVGGRLAAFAYREAGLRGLTSVVAGALPRWVGYRLGWAFGGRRRSGGG